MNDMLETIHELFLALARKYDDRINGYYNAKIPHYWNKVKPQYDKYATVILSRSDPHTSFSSYVVLTLPHVKAGRLTFSWDVVCPRYIAIDRSKTDYPLSSEDAILIQLDDPQSIDNLERHIEEWFESTLLQRGLWMTK